MRSAERTTDELTVRRDTLAAQADEVQRRELRDDRTGQQLLTRLDELSLSAATTAVIGPGVSVVITDPGQDRDLSDVSKQRLPGTGGHPRPRPATGGQLAVGQRRRGDRGGRRAAGPERDDPAGRRAILVDNHPISSPYTVAAIGPPNTMLDSFNRSTGLHRLRLLEASYRVGGEREQRRRPVAARRRGPRD